MHSKSQRANEITRKEKRESHIPKELYCRINRLQRLCRVYPIKYNLKTAILSSPF